MDKKKSILRLRLQAHRLQDTTSRLEKLQQKTRQLSDMACSLKQQTQQHTSETSSILTETSRWLKLVSSERDDLRAQIQVDSLLINI